MKLKRVIAFFFQSLPCGLSQESHFDKILTSTITRTGNINSGIRLSSL